ncbi:hypothetical protein CAI21_21390 [Alkalilimnicola ehrlichii]|uniref:Uncharacterized protein n=1 Tax=Alkalilimnicola ehrlichii TaxID=351052 RepID=A0A3E0WGQ3_9GAMM|nr:hypothetical protein [Alkalilimnicola ehrlichii]RFA24496.1 hypothetical protein CAI21_21390 [Alkalilimnicola ehrlichii]RFA32160.1 hypothetical protein CAL65_20270 [Alkalilimnicola ehrlichii]
MSDYDNPYEKAATRAVELGNRLAELDQDAHLWDIADGLLAGAIQYWLYSRQPCADPACEECATIRSGELRLQELLRLAEEFARSSEYFDSPSDFGVGHA